MYLDLKYICYNWLPLISDHVLDFSETVYHNANTSRLHDKEDFNPYMVRHGDFIFVKTDYIMSGEFESLYLNKIIQPFHLITGISDYKIEECQSYENIIKRPNLLSWTCVNPPNMLNDKIKPVLIGFQEPDRPGGNLNLLNNIAANRKNFNQKKDKIFLPFHGQTNQKREEKIKFISSLDFVESQDKKQDLESYYNSISEHKFCVCLEGNGPDTHRISEVILAGSIPVIDSRYVKVIFDMHDIDYVFVDDFHSLSQELFKDVLKRRYDIEKNNKIIDIEYNINFIKKGEINGRSN